MSAPYFTAPRYSFVQPQTDTDSCYPDPALCLPCSSQDNLAFQVRLYGIDTLGIFFDFLIIKAVIVPVDYTCDQYVKTQGFVIDPIFIASNHYYFQEDGSLMANLDSPNGTFIDISGNEIPIGGCFKLAIYLDVYAGGFLADQTLEYAFGCTVPFRRVAANDCYTSALSYTNPDDAFGFDYSDFADHPFINKVELPFYLRDPKMESDEKVYTKSDGSITKIYERKEEVYTLETDSIPYVWHKALDIALSHDTVGITNANLGSFDPVNTASQFVKKENYEIEYNKAPLSNYGKGTCKLSNAAPVNLINNNCG
jgi:hypothetical protein